MEEETAGDCLYCGAPDVSGEVPDISNGKTWKRLEEYHNVGCEWVKTRAHRINMNNKI